MKWRKSAWKKFKGTKFCKTLKEYVGADDLIALIIVIIGGLYYCKTGPLPYHAGWHAFYERIHVELIGIGITVLILGNANQFIQIKQEKRRLILQMGSPDNGFAREAVRQLGARGWLDDGTLMKAELRRANLEGADLEEVDLRNIIYNAFTTWTGATFNKATQWPDGFDPEAAGCILVEDE